MTELLTRTREIAEAVASARERGGTIALVPTMGALHDGHLSLVRCAGERASFVVVSVFVNPTQFGANEDFDAYPRDLDHDRELLESAGVDAIFAPSAEEMYPPGFDTLVKPGAVSHLWEGAARPGHFAGVATVVTKLFEMVHPDFAFFGEKDYQQLKVIEQTARDLNLAVGIVGCPTVRDADGLALSSRNAYLSSRERGLALCVPAALQAAVDAAEKGERDASRLVELMRTRVESAGVAVDYAAVVDPDTLVPVRQVTGPARALIAAFVGSTRLIDNRAIGTHEIPT